ncbi:MAG: RIP metalloprotease RseP [Patescibacteria group bacterium]
MLTTILVFAIILGLLVFVHEFGHFISAKKLGAKVEEFGFGFPPRAIGVYKNHEGKMKLVFRKTPEIKNTIYSLNWIPLGGFVRIKGEDGEGKSDPESFASKPVWKRAIILGAGVMMNFILAIIIMAIGYGIGMPQAIEGEMNGANIKDRALQIVSVTKQSPAATAGMQAGDEIVAVDGRELDFKELQAYATSQVGKEINYTIKRQDDTLNLKAVPSILKETGYGGIGIGLVETGVVSYPWHLALWRGTTETLFFIKEIFIALGTLIKDLFIGKGASVDLSGPIGIAVLTGRVARLGLIYLLQFTALLSVNLGVVNILPFPALDGGRILFLIIEKIRRRPMSQRLEAAIHNIGFLFLMLLVVVITYRDFIKFGDKFSNLWQNIIK